MSRRRARPRPAALLLLAASASVLVACGGSEPAAESSASPSADPAVTECREQWRDLADEVDDELGDDSQVPSGLRARWVTVTAQISYYAASGAAGDCEETLAREQDTIAALQDFSEELAPLDVELALSGYERSRDLTSYARPSGREGRAAPSPRQVTRALADLRRLAPEATADQSAGWQQAAVTDVADAKARRKAVADLEVLSGESSAYRRARAAITVLDRAIEAVGGDPVDEPGDPSDEPSSPSPSPSPGAPSSDGSQAPSPSESADD